MGLAFWTLLPLVAPQALRVRRTAPRFRAAEGPTEGLAGDTAAEPLRLAAIGDSIVAGVGADRLEEAFVGRTAAALAALERRPVAWAAHGWIGADAGRVADRATSALDPRPVDVFLVSVGVNDVTSLATVARWRAGLGRLLDALDAHSPGAVTVVCGVPPMGDFPLLPRPTRDLFGLRARELDRAARALLAARPRAAHLPLDFEPTPERFAGDGYHPSPDGYRELGEAAAALAHDARRAAGAVSSP